MALGVDGVGDGVSDGVGDGVSDQLSHLATTCVPHLAITSRITPSSPAHLTLTCLPAHHTLTCLPAHHTLTCLLDGLCQL